MRDFMGNAIFHMQVMCTIIYFPFMFCLKNVSDNVDNCQRTRKSKTSALHGVKFVINVLCKHSAFTLCVFHLNG